MVPLRRGNAATTRKARRDKQGQAGTSRDKEGQTGTRRDKQGQVAYWGLFVRCVAEDRDTDPYLSN